MFVLALALWLSALRLFYRPSATELRPPDQSVSALARPLIERQVAAWSMSEASTPEIHRMRASNPEWDLMARTYLVLALANVALREPSRAGEYVLVIDRVIDDTIALERARGQGYFLLPYARARAWVHPSQRSLFVDGEVALMVAARRMLRDDREDFRRVLGERAAQIEAQMGAGPIASAESYPDECWTFCNTVALAALRVREGLDGVTHEALVQRWLGYARARLVDRSTGLLVSSYTLEGAVREGPEGSSIYMVAHDLALLDRRFAEDQYRRARAAQRRNPGLRLRARVACAEPARGGHRLGAHGSVGGSQRGGERVGVARGGVVRRRRDVGRAGGVARARGVSCARGEDEAVPREQRRRRRRAALLARAGAAVERGRASARGARRRSAMKRLFAVISLLITLAWLSLRALGWTRYAAVLSGSVPEGAVSVSDSTQRAVLLLAVHFAFVLFAAPLALSALGLHAWDVVSRARSRRAG